MRSGWHPPGLLFGGACQRSALETCASLAMPPAWDWSPRPLTGTTAQTRDVWITTGVTKSEAGACARLGRTPDREHAVLAVEGAECERPCDAPGAAGDAAAWNERRLVV